MKIAVFSKKLNMMRFCISLSHIFFGILGSESQSTAADMASKEIERILSRIDENRPEDIYEWKKILYYSTDMFGRERSMVDDPNYFLSEVGKTNPSEEMRATIQALFQPVPLGEYDDNSHPRCQFLRRESWFVERTGLNRELMPRPRCENFENFTSQHHFIGASLIFSSSFPNNPSSLFGHTFIRLHEKPKTTDQVSHDLLDSAINFSAFPDTTNPLLYTLRGVAGFFPGRFSFTPYYFKVQEYSNAESRDLWEYRLSFTQKDVENMVFALWEMGQHHIDYYYFDENCSEVILHFLEATKPTLNLTHFKVWVIPADTVRAVTETDGLSAPPKYRPSALSRFLAKYKALTDSQKSLLRSIVATNSVHAAKTDLASLSERDAAVLIDALVEYIDYDEKLAGTKDASKFFELRKTALLLRAKLPVTNLNTHEQNIPYHDQPDTGHQSTRIRTGFGQINNRLEFVEALWRPSLHDHLSSNQGYAAGLGIDFWDINLRYFPKQKRGVLDRFSILRILSQPTLERFVRAPSWTLNLGTEADYSCLSRDHDLIGEFSVCHKTALGAGIGWTELNKPTMLSAFTMAGLSLGQNTGLNRRWFAEPSLEIGLRWTPGETFKVEASHINSVVISKGNKPIPVRHLHAHVAVTPKTNHEIRGDFRRSSLAISDWSLGYLYYF